MANMNKQPSTIRLPESGWALLEEIRQKEGWTKSAAIYELIKLYAKQNDITLPVKEDNDHAK